METYHLAHFPPSCRVVHIALFHDVSNAPEIRQRLIAAATMPGAEGDTAREEVDFGFLEGSLIVSREHLLTAIQTTILNSLLPDGNGSSALQTRSHNLHSELLLSLSPNNNITDSIRRHGLSDATRVLVVVRIEPASAEHSGSGSSPGSKGEGRLSVVGQQRQRQEEVWRAMDKVVHGRLVSLDHLDQGAQVDWPRVDKVYKLAEMNAALKALNPQLPLEARTERKRAVVINSVAIKSVT